MAQPDRLEENALGDHGRVEPDRNGKLQMQHVDPSQENIVVQNKDKRDAHESSSETQNRSAEEQAFISWRFALLCGCILLALVLLGRAAWLQIIARICWCVRAICVRCVFGRCLTRGMITDRSGVRWRSACAGWAIWADPKSS